ncbi:MAG: oligosaccharide flippase family protein [Bacteroidales bacterium]|nr:oligosaccharide flippase family protein [Bacteroidales bacterium]
MLRKILATSGTRIMNAVSSLIVLWIATNALGSEAWGTAGIILLDISLVLLVVELVTGSAIVFHSSKENFTSLLLLSAIWTVFIIGIFALLFFIVSYFPHLYSLMIPEGYGKHILILSLINGFYGFNLNALLGREKLKSFNSLFVLQFTLLLITMAASVYIFEVRDERAFVLALYVSYSIPAIIGWILMVPLLEKPSFFNLRIIFRRLFNFGSMTQLSSIAHLINKRMSFYVIKQYLGLAPLGVYNSGIQLTEGLRLIGQSISLVQFSSLSNSNSDEYARVLSIQLLKFSVLLTSLALLVLIAVPKEVFETIFSKDFGDIKIVIISLAPGVVFLAANTIFSHYFSGTGQPKYNLYASLVGLIVTIPAVFLLIPAFHLVGAGISASLAYGASVMYQWIVFKKLTRTKTAELRIRSHEIKAFAVSIRKLFSSK